MLREFLDRLYDRYNEPGLLTSDPLEYPHRYLDPYDQEAVALFSALMAYGNVKQIRRSIEDLLGRIHGVAEGPAAFIRAIDDSRHAAAQRKALHGFIHRFNLGADFFLLCRLLARSWREHGSLGAHFLKGHEPAADDISGALNALIDEWRSWAGNELTDSAAYLFTAPRDGSCCKRWCMFLRWMGRKDSVDLGLWAKGSPLAVTFPPGRFLRPEQLIIPIDTHTGRISQYLGLTKRKSMGWLAAVEVTKSLRKCTPEDPTRYDFALARLGILDLCQKRFRVEICRNCELLPVCRFARRRIPT